VALGALKAASKERVTVFVTTDEGAKFALGTLQAVRAPAAALDCPPSPA